MPMVLLSDAVIPRPMVLLSDAVTPMPMVLLSDHSCYTSANSSLVRQLLSDTL